VGAASDRGMGRNSKKWKKNVGLMGKKGEEVEKNKNQVQVEKRGRSGERAIEKAFENRPPEQKGLKRSGTFVSGGRDRIYE